MFLSGRWFVRCMPRRSRAAGFGVAGCAGVGTAGWDSAPAEEETEPGDAELPGVVGGFGFGLAGHG
jgi:hypothetical protein